MKIGVNLLFLVPGDVGGSEPLLINLVQAMLDGGSHEFVIFGVKGFSRAFPHIAEKAQVIEAPWSGGAQALRIPAEHTWLPISARRRKLDVIHHGVGTTPFIRALPTVVTIHDVHYRHYPENFVMLKRAWLRVNVPYSARRSNVVTVPSNWVKQDLVSAFGIQDDRVAVVPFGSEDLFGPHPASVEAVRDIYHLERPYFFYPGRAYPHKNHLFLLKAFAPLAADADLVFSGPPLYRDAEIDKTAAELGISRSLRRLGKVPRGHLAGLFAGAVALAYPSLFEGFGAPAIEAMSVGCPVIASNVCSLPEVVNGAGILLNPGDAESWTEAMAKLLADQSLVDDLSAKGLRRATEFSWKRSAELQLDAYRKAAS